MAFLPHPLQSLRIVSGLLVPREDNPTAEPKSHPRSCFLLTRPPHPARLVSLPLRHTGDFPAHTVPCPYLPILQAPIQPRSFWDGNVLSPTWNHQPALRFSAQPRMCVLLLTPPAPLIGRLRAFLRPAGGARTALRLQLLGQVSPLLILTPALWPPLHRKKS